MSGPAYVARRIGVALIQALVMTTAVFVLLRLLPGDPSYALAGPTASDQQLAAIRSSLRLDQSMWSQYIAYVGNLVQGDWGKSITSGQGVLDDIWSRFPTTFELITVAMVAGVLITVPWATWSAIRPSHPLARVGSVYGRLAGSMPDFWLGIVLVLVFYTWLHVAPAPTGQLGLLDSAPPRVTGLGLIDSLLAGRFDAFGTTVQHLVLPVTALTVVYSGSFYRQTRVGVEREMRTERVLYGRASGLSEWALARRSLRNVLAPIVAIIGTTYGFMIGGAVLIESVFSWGGLGQYAVQAVQSSDYFAISGVVLITSLFTLVIYLIVDLVQAAIDPRIRLT